MKHVYGTCAIAALLCLLVVGAGAVGIVANKHDYVSNETISYQVSNMTDGVEYSQKTTVYQYVAPGMPSEFGNNNITWPFAHRNDTFNMTNINTTSNSVVIGHWWPPSKGGYEEASWDGLSADIVGPTGTVVKNTWNRTFSYEDEQTGTYQSHWKATPAPGATIVTSIFWINGTKLSGPTDFSQNTSVWTRNPALVHIDWYENNVLTANDWFTVDVDRSAVPTYIAAVVGSGMGSGAESYSGGGAVATTTTSASGTGAGTASGTGSSAVVTTAVAGGSATGSATPAGMETVAGGNASAQTTATPAGSPFAIAALGALGVGALLLAGRGRR